MKLKARLDRIVDLIQCEYDKAAEKEERPFHIQHHDTLLLEDELSTVMDDEDEDHWREGNAHVVRPFPDRPMTPHGGLEPIEEEGAGGEIKAAERGCPECPRGASAHRAPSPCATCGPSYKDKVLGAMIERLAGLEVDAGVAPDARRAWAVAISALEAGNRAALQAVKRACQEGVDPEDAMEQVVAVLGRPAERKGAGGAKNKQQQKQKPKDKKHVVKHVACVCM